MADLPRVTTIDIPLEALIRRADPDWQRMKHRELQYDFPKPGRHFYADPYIIGAYTPGGMSFDTGFDLGFES